MTRSRGLPGLALCAALALGAALPAAAQQPSGTAAPATASQPPSQPPPSQPPPSQPPPGQSTETVDAEAFGLLTRMAETLAKAQRLSVTIQGRYDVTQDTGEKVEFGERRTVMLNRPDQLRVDVQESDGHRRQVGFDGKAITVFDPDQKVYGQIDKTGSVDDAIHALINELQIRVPLALLFTTTLAADLDQRLAALEYVERDTLTRVPTHHLSGSTERVDFQIWIAADGPPLPERVVITYSDDDGAPQYRADLTDWTLNAGTAPDSLAFRPPDGSERVPFLVRVQRADNQRPASAGGTPNASGSTAGSMGGPSK